MVRVALRPDGFFIARILRCSDIFKLNKLMTNFQEIINNIFLPLFEVTNDPHTHPELHKFLQYVCFSISYYFSNFCYCYYAFLNALLLLLIRYVIIIGNRFRFRGR